MGNSIGDGVGNLLGQFQAGVATVAEQAEERLPDAVKPQVAALTSAVDEFVSSKQVLTQLGVPAPVAPPPLTTEAQVRSEYKKDASRDLTDAATLKQLNDELKAQDPNAKPLTAAEAKSIIDNADVRSLTPRQYADLKAAAGPGASSTNPATAVDADNRAKLKDVGPENLARARLRSQGSSADPTPEQLAQAEKDLRAIDPGIFATPPKDVVYVNQKHVEHQGDPRQTKVASHEFLHLILDHRQVPGKQADGSDPQHAIIGRLGWNQTFGTSGQVIPGETANWATPPGQGLPERK